MMFSRPASISALFPLLACLILLACTTTNAQQPTGQPQSPAVQQPRLQRPTNIDSNTREGQELFAILKNWERAGDITEKLEGKHARYIYDYVFFVEKWSEGEFYYESPDKGRLDLEPHSAVKAGMTRNRNGKDFTVEADKAESWVCDGTQILAIDSERKEYQRMAIPVENRGQNISDGPLPFLFGISVDKIVARYYIELHDDPAQGGQHDLAAGKIHLKVKPLWQQDAANWETAEVMLDAKTYLPHAIRMVHPGANAETVYVFSEMKRNSSRGVFKIWQGSPFEPKLSGFRELVIDDQAANRVEQKR